MSARARALRAGAATAMGSLPHAEPAAAAQLAVTAHRQLPALPELPAFAATEGLLERPFSDDDPAALLDFVAAARAADAPAVKAQVAGPLTLGMSLLERGARAAEAFEQAAIRSTAAATALVSRLREGLPHADVVLFLDEPALVAWPDEPPVERELAVDLMSSVLSAVDAVTGIHVCGTGDRRMAIEAGPDVVAFSVDDSVVADGVAIGRYLDAGGWVAWGAVPTDRPVGAEVEHWWNALVAVWCDLTRGGCDPVTLRTQALITPACGLVRHSEEQAARILAMCVEIGERVREQAVATRLSVGA